jgi:hypothetical protein
VSAVAPIGVVGGIKVAGKATLKPKPTTGIAVVSDPLSWLIAPSLSATTPVDVSVTGGNSRQLSPGSYGHIEVSGGSTLTLAPGTYVISGALTVSGRSTLMGSGVTLYFTCTASGKPSSGGLGVAIMYDRNNAAQLTVSGGSSDSITGSVYAPAAPLSLSGGSDAPTINGLVVVDTLTVTGNATVSVQFGSAMGP